MNGVFQSFAGWITCKVNGKKKTLLDGNLHEINMNVTGACVSADRAPRPQTHPLKRKVHLAVAAVRQEG